MTFNRESQYIFQNNCTPVQFRINRKRLFNEIPSALMIVSETTACPNQVVFIYVGFKKVLGIVRPLAGFPFDNPRHGSQITRSRKSHIRG